MVRTGGQELANLCSGNYTQQGGSKGWAGPVHSWPVYVGKSKISQKHTHRYIKKEGVGGMAAWEGNPEQTLHFVYSLTIINSEYINLEEKYNFLMYNLLECNFVKQSCVLKVCRIWVLIQVES